MSTVKSPKYHVFISHSSQDRTWADAACGVLEERKMRCWIAPRDITPGTEWGASIVDGIDRSKVMVLIFSSNANESPQVRREVERAIGKSIPILPLRIEDIRPQGSMEFALSNTHWLDAFAPPIADRLSQLADSVELLLGVKKSSRPTTATTAKPVEKVVRKSRMLWIVGSVILASVAIVYSVFAMLGGKRGSTATSDSVSAGATPSMEQTSASNSAGKFRDETMNFQGRWVAIAESTRGNVFPASRVADRQYTIAILEHNWTHRKKPTETAIGSLEGSVTFETDGNEHNFNVRGVDEDGVRIVWNGIYRTGEGYLELCYRFKPSEGPRDAAIRPEVFLVNGARGTSYLKLVHPRNRPKN